MSMGSRTSMPSTASMRRLISIAPTELLAGSLPKRDLRLVLAWAQLHESELLENWERARRSERLAWIEPLR